MRTDLWLELATTTGINTMPSLTVICRKTSPSLSFRCTMSTSTEIGRLYLVRCCVRDGRADTSTEFRRDPAALLPKGNSDARPSCGLETQLTQGCLLIDTTQYLLKFGAYYSGVLHA